jgi:5'-3' exonuclease
MNQQRQRRLRTAQESKEALEKARESGEKVQVRASPSLES